jgi:hypothetical protein
MYVYIKTEPQLWTVGFYDPSGEWHTDSDHDIREEAAERVAYLNGGRKEPEESEEWRDYKARRADWQEYLDRKERQDRGEY